MKFILSIASAVLISINCSSSPKNNTGDTIPKISTVTIGSQNWTTKNLDVSTYRNGDAIPQVTDPSAWANLTTGAWCYYNNDAANGSIYGKLYNWYAVKDRRGLAPLGYHIPSDAEWTTLTTYLGSEPGKQLKTTSGWNNEGNGTNISGFAGLPGGLRYGNGSFSGIGASGLWWSSSEDDAAYTWSRFLYFSYSDVGRYDANKTLGFVVRCLRD